MAYHIFRDYFPSFEFRGTLSPRVKWFLRMGQLMDGSDGLNRRRMRLPSTEPKVLVGMLPPREFSMPSWC